MLGMTKQTAKAHHRLSFSLKYPTVTYGIFIGNPHEITALLAQSFNNA
jgi:hypothetical protein